jgi:serine/threonine protein kinase
MSHENIIYYYDSFIMKEKLCIIMEYAENKDLKAAIREKISKNEKFSEEQVQ